MFVIAINDMEIMEELQNQNVTWNVKEMATKYVEVLIEIIFI